MNSDMGGQMGDERPIGGWPNLDSLVKTRFEEVPAIWHI